MAIPGNVGNYNPSAKRGAFARSPVTPSSAKRGVFGASPSAAKKGIFAFTPGGGSGSAFAPKKTSFAPSPRQAEDYSMDLLQKRREKTRQDFFKGREDISNQRLDKRQIQADLFEQFKQSNFKPVTGTDGTLFYQDQTLQFDTDPMSPTFGQYKRTTLADKATELAMKYGPTGREIMSDMGYAIGSMAKGAGDILKQGGIGPLSIIKQIYDQYVGGAKPSSPTVPSGLTPGQVNLYNNLIGNGMNPAMALEQAKRYVPEGPFPKSFAVGGIATLS